ncbi:unnamed protein product [Brassica oleracea]
MSKDAKAMSMIREITDRYVGHGYDNQDLEVCFDDIMKEERRSARIAREENEMEVKLIAEGEERERQRKLLKLRLHEHYFCDSFIIFSSQRSLFEVSNGDQRRRSCLPPATEPLRCYFPSSTTPLAELETIQSLEIVEPSFLSPAWLGLIFWRGTKVRMILIHCRYYVGKDLESIAQGNSRL